MEALRKATRRALRESGRTGPEKTDAPRRTRAGRAAALAGVAAAAAALLAWRKA
jgi:hypothetical protein